MHPMIEEFGEKDTPNDLLRRIENCLEKWDGIFKKEGVATNEEIGNGIEPSLSFHKNGSLADLLLKYLIHNSEEGRGIGNNCDL